MHTSLRLALVLACALTLGRPTPAQDVQPSKPIFPSPLVTASVAGERVRFAAPGGVVQLRLEVYDEAGRKLFDTEQRGGNVLDWHLVDGQGQRAATGTYACVVTVKSLTGRLTQHVGTVLITEQGGVAVQTTDVATWPAVVQQAVGPLEADTGIAVVQPGEIAAATIVAHNGSDGEVVSTRGALTFRVGDFFSGTDREQMRLTEEGNVGIGTRKPQAKLDVAGDIRATGLLHLMKGVEFADGTVQTTGLSGHKDKEGNIIPAASGSGTQGRLAKWTDNAGTLGDALAIDTGTGLQLTAAPSSAADTNLLYLNSTNGTTGVLAGSTPSYGANNGPFFAMRGNTYTTIAQQRGLFTIAAGNVANPQGDDGSVKFNTGNDVLRMVIRPSGNVGIGTISPQATLDVTGTARIAPGGSGGVVNFGTPNAETGLSIIGTNRADVRFDGSTLKLLAGQGVTSPANGIAIDTTGNVGIGMFAPQGKLVVNAGGSGGEVRFHTPNGESGLSIIGTNRADVRFDGSTLKLLAGTGPGAMASTNGININASGNVGIGTTTPGAKLDVVASGTAVNVTSQANAIIGVSSTANFAAIYGENTSSAGGPGVYGKGTSGYAMYADGNVAQARDKGGWVKAMALINRDGVVVRCYNSQLAGSAASTAPCGITVVHSLSSGGYNVTFNFRVDDRFISVTASKDTDFMVANIGSLSGNTVAVETALNSETNDQQQNTSSAQFTIFVY